MDLNQHQKENKMENRKEHLTKRISFHETEMMKAYEAGETETVERQSRLLSECVDELEVIEQNETLSVI